MLSTQVLVEDPAYCVLNVSIPHSLLIKHLQCAILGARDSVMSETDIEPFLVETISYGGRWAISR